MLLLGAEIALLPSINTLCNLIINIELLSVFD